MAQTTWQFDPAHTLIEFSAKHMMISTVKGRFAGVTGTITDDDANPANSSVKVEIDANSVDTRDEKRDAHLRSADFLDVENHPAITFVSTNVTSLGGERLRLTGDLTIRGTTRQITFEGTRNGTNKTPWGSEVAGFSADTSINRKDFNLVWNVALETGGILVGDTVKISLEVEAIKQS